MSFRGSEIASLSLHKGSGLGPLHATLIVCYSVALYFVVTTLGLPYQTALDKALVETPPEGSDFLPPCQPLPWPYYPSFMSRMGFVGVCLLHILSYLLQIWSVNFLTFIKYTKADLTDATVAKVHPPAHHGKSAVVPVLRTPKGTPFFLFQKHKFIYEKGDTPGDTDPAFRKVTCPDSLALKEYLTSGLDRAEVKERKQRYGENKFEIELPSFKDLYIEGLLKPFTVFQFFCVLLWSLDEYWQYSMFTLVMMFVFEGTVVMSRTKNLKTLRGMNNQPRTLLAKRGGVWATVSAEDLVPGDLISVTRGTREDDVIPCDCLLLRGSAVVNEATLTGESIPQMKEALVVDETNREESLDINGLHKVSMLWGGTRILQQTCDVAETSLSVPTDGTPAPSDEAVAAGPSAVPTGTPDGGCVAVVLRTGFNSSQGFMVRMIEFSSDSVSGNTKEAALLVLFLLCFAVAASAYVLKRGMEDERDSFSLLLHCILIITSVIPPELNMQMALAVNSSLLTLIKQHIFCTEPYRIPLAGKTSICLFDKTGTITTDELVASGVVNIAPKPAHPSAAASSGAHPEEPISATNLMNSIILAGCHSLVEVDKKITGDPLETAAINAIKWTYDASTRIARPREGERPAWPKGAEPSVEILNRYHFSSKLQRMSVVAHVKQHAHDKGSQYVLTKGSPEAIQALCDPETIPAWFYKTHTSLTKQGRRVIALAYKHIETVPREKIPDMGRDWAESKLTFAGFFLFRCLIRKDSKDVITGLVESSHAVGMVTGDAILTAIHVAGEVNMCKKDRAQLLVLAAEGARLVWKNAETDAVVEEYKEERIEALSRDHDLCVTGESLSAASERGEGIWKQLDKIRVYARMTPDKKEKVLMALKDNGMFTLMSGDGANDVGALKQAHVGIALLSGFGSTNAEKLDGEEKKSAPAVGAAGAAPAIAGNATGGQVAKEAEKPKLSPREEQARLNKERQEALLKDIAERKARGESWAEWNAMKEMLKKDRERLAQQRGPMGGGSLEASAAMLAAKDLDDGSVPMVKLGDASIAAPFTSKKASISSAIDVIRQGRCTLVTTLQMYQILALHCLISSYSLSALYLDGIKFGDYQMTAMGLLMTVSFLSVSRASPLQKLSPVRPLNTIFHPALFLSLIGQFAIHLACMMYTVSLAKPYLPENWEPNLEGKFEPNLINSVVFLVTCVQNVVVFVVNYKGLPFMTGLTENKFLMYALTLCGVGAFVCAGNFIPILNKGMQLVAYPSDSFQNAFMTVLIINVVATFLWDRLMLAIFAPDILKASFQGLDRKTIVSVVKAIGIVTALLYFFAVDPEQLEAMQKEAERRAAAAAAN